MRRRKVLFGGAAAALLAACSGDGVETVAPPPAAPQLPEARLPPASPTPAGRLLQLQPARATSAQETHSALVVSNASFGAEGSPYRFAGRMRTVRQLREVNPNAWEVAWLFWNYVDKDHLCYFALKPNGWEIGKRDPRFAVPGVNDGQKVLATGESEKLALGEWNEFEIRVDGASAEIFIDGRSVCDFHDEDRDALLGGRVGFYTEDAACQWDSVSAPMEDGFEGEPLQAFADGTQIANWRVAFLGYGSGGIVAADPA